MRLPGGEAASRAALVGAPLCKADTGYGTRGGALLTVPGGAAEVLVSSAAGYRAEWNGRDYLRLRDLDPGVYRAKVRATGGGATSLTDFSVDAGRTCLWTLAAAGRWERGECR